MLLLLARATPLPTAHKQAPCVDVPPDSRFTCAQQRHWGKCGEPWMRGFCCKSCHGCRDECTVRLRQRRGEDRLKQDVDGPAPVIKRTPSLRWGDVVSQVRPGARFEQSAALDAFCGEAFDEARFVDRTRLSGGVVLAVDAATDARTQRPVVLKRAPEGMAIHLANELLPSLLNVSGAHVMTAAACFRGGVLDGVSSRVATYERMDGTLKQLLDRPPREADARLNYETHACFALQMMHQTLVGLAATHARGLVNQDLHAGNLLMRREGNYLRWRVADFGRACLVNASCAQRPGTQGIAPEAGHVPLTPASDVWSAGVVFLLVRCFAFEMWHRNGHRAHRDWMSRLNRAYGEAAAAAAARARRAAARVPIPTERERQAFENAAAAAARARAAPPAAWDNFTSLLDMLPKRCAPLAQHAGHEAPRENVLLAAMLALRWEKRPSASWLAVEFADLVRRRCPRAREPGKSNVTQIPRRPGDLEAVVKRMAADGFVKNRDARGSYYSRPGDATMYRSRAEVAQRFYLDGG